MFLDASDALEDELSTGLPNDPGRAAALVQERMSGVDGQRINDQLRVAQQGVADAWSLRITRVPAVVVDKSYVVYGISDVGQAEALIAEWRAGDEK